MGAQGLASELTVIKVVALFYAYFFGVGAARLARSSPTAGVRVANARAA